MDIKEVSVIGGGTMGNGITHVFALKKFKVNLVEMNKELVDKAISTISKNIDRQIKKGIVTSEEKVEILKQINPVTEVKNIPPTSDLVIEAIYENRDAKINLFNILAEIIKGDSIFASNTSSISITELAKNHRPEKFIGMHFMNPVPVMKLVEIIKIR